MRFFKITFVLTSFFGVPVYADTSYNPELSLIQSGHSAEAYNQLRPKLLGSAGNPDFDTAFGLAALDNGATAEAVAALERVLAVQPANLPVRTELARAYEQLGDPAAAARELDIVKQQPETPATVRTNISHYASALDEALSGGPRTLTGTVNVTTGYDSNINNATTSSYLIVPALAALGPARIADGAQAESSGYTEAGATLTYRQPLSVSKALFASASVNQKSPFNSSDYSQTTLGAEGGIQLLSPDNGKLTLGASAQQFWFGGDDYSTTLGVTANWELPLTTTSNLISYATASHISYEQNASQNANRIVVGAMLDNHFQQTTYTPYTFAGIYGGTEKTTDSSSDYLSNNLVGAQAGIEFYPARNFSTFFDATYEVRDYSADYPMFMEARLDKQLDLTTGISYALASNLLLRPTLAYRYANSNIAFYNYTRWLANVGLRYSF